MKWQTQARNASYGLCNAISVHVVIFIHAPGDILLSF